ncbi:hypothetical protein C2845_PM13G05350 [Panicum miliaceum]|uniref:Uncharacterized protein n=1 Tax=Panicum miliaceum TaxID=4540 RepID=A0A3L6RK47_PANMI|nr:hypothetical protein C2845_PM13G05350 [Panicum miliaceum]
MAGGDRDTYMRDASGRFCRAKDIAIGGNAGGGAGKTGARVVRPGSSSTHPPPQDGRVKRRPYTRGAARRGSFNQGSSSAKPRHDADGDVGKVVEGFKKAARAIELVILDSDSGDDDLDSGDDDSDSGDKDSDVVRCTSPDHLV